MQLLYVSYFLIISANCSRDLSKKKSGQANSSSQQSTNRRRGRGYEANDHAAAWAGHSATSILSTPRNAPPVHDAITFAGPLPASRTAPPKQLESFDTSSNPDEWPDLGKPQSAKAVQLTNDKENHEAPPSENVRITHDTDHTISATNPFALIMDTQYSMQLRLYALPPNMLEASIRRGERCYYRTPDNDPQQKLMGIQRTDQGSFCTFHMYTILTARGSASAEPTQAQLQFYMPMVEKQLDISQEAIVAIGKALEEPVLCPESAMANIALLEKNSQPSHSVLRKLKPESHLEESDLVPHPHLADASSQELMVRLCMFPQQDALGRYIMDGNQFFLRIPTNPPGTITGVQQTSTGIRTSIFPYINVAEVTDLPCYQALVHTTDLDNTVVLIGSEVQNPIQSLEDLDLFINEAIRKYENRLAQELSAVDLSAMVYAAVSNIFHDVNLATACAAMLNPSQEESSSADVNLATACATVSNPSQLEESSTAGVNLATACAPVSNPSQLEESSTAGVNLATACAAVSNPSQEESSATDVTPANICPAVSNLRVEQCPQGDGNNLPTIAKVMVDILNDGHYGFILMGSPKSEFRVFNHVLLAIAVSQLPGEFTLSKNIEMEINSLTSNHILRPTRLGLTSENPDWEAYQCHAQNRVITGEIFQRLELFASSELRPQFHTSVVVNPRRADSPVNMLDLIVFLLDDDKFRPIVAWVDKSKHEFIVTDIGRLAIAWKFATNENSRKAWTIIFDTRAMLKSAEEFDSVLSPQRPYDSNVRKIRESVLHRFKQRRKQIIGQYGYMYMTLLHILCAGSSEKIERAVREVAAGQQIDEIDEAKCGVD